MPGGKQYRRQRGWWALVATDSRYRPRQTAATVAGWWAGGVGLVGWFDLNAGWWLVGWSKCKEPAESSAGSGGLWWLVGWFYVCNAIACAMARINVMSG